MSTHVNRPTLFYLLHYYWVPQVVSCTENQPIAITTWSFALMTKPQHLATTEVKDRTKDGQVKWTMSCTRWISSSRSVKWWLLKSLDMYESNSVVVNLDKHIETHLQETQTLNKNCLGAWMRNTHTHNHFEMDHLWAPTKEFTLLEWENTQTHTIHMGNPMSKYKRIHPAWVKTSKLIPFIWITPWTNTKEFILLEWKHPNSHHLIWTTPGATTKEFFLLCQAWS